MEKKTRAPKTKIIENKTPGRRKHGVHGIAFTY